MKILTNTTYGNYIDKVINNLCTLLSNIINFKTIKFKKHSINYNFNFYLNLLTLKSNNLVDGVYNEYLNTNYNCFYSIIIPLKINFNNLKYFYVNYNVINIPKITQTGDFLLNGYFRISTLYLTLSVKCIFIKLINLNVKQYLIKLKDNLYLYIYVYNNKVDIYLNSYRIINDYFNIYNNLIFKNKYINFNCINNVIYVLNCKNNKKLKLFKKIIYVDNLLNNLFYLEIFNIINKFINIQLNKKFKPHNDNLINKYSNSILDSILKIFVNKYTYIYNLLQSIKYTSENKEYKNSLSLILFKENLLTNPLLHYTDQLNSLSYLSDKFKINVFGYSNNINNKFTVNPSLRKIKNDYFGFIDILYTSDGEDCGLLGKLSNNTFLDKFKLKLVIDTDYNLENFMFLDINSKNLNNIIINNFSNYKKNKYFKVKTFEILENNEFKITKITNKNNLKYLDLSNILSISELLIPFLFNDDPCRGLMGAKMHKQALPLLYNENSCIITKYNFIDNFLSFKYIVSLYDGVVVEVDNCRILILDNKDRLINYYLYPFNISDYNSYIDYRPTVWKGENVCIGKIIAISNDLKNSEFTLGFNNFVNYNFYEGYEHEDAIIINKNLLVDDVLTSISFDVYEYYLSLNKFDYVELTIPKFLKYNRYNRYAINKSGIFGYNYYMCPGDLLMSKLKYELSTSKNKQLFKLFKLLFFNNKRLVTTNTFLCINKGEGGRLVKFEILSYDRFKQFDYIYDDVYITYLTFRFFIFRIDRIKIGDKLCGRHGNKGVISKIVDVTDLPYTYYGLYPDSITSPIGAISRINLGQFLEGCCGYFGFNNDIRIQSPINLHTYYLYNNLYVKSLYNYSNKYCYFYDTYLGRSCLRDFKTGYKLKNFNLSLLSYYFKLMHTSKSKFNYRTTGKYSDITQQPVKGKNNNGGQKFGEMEVWALEAHGSSYNIRELSFIKTNFNLSNKFFKNYKCSESFKILYFELKNILINIQKNVNYKFTNNSLKFNY